MAGWDSELDLDLHWEMILFVAAKLKIDITRYNFITQSQPGAE